MFWDSRLKLDLLLSCVNQQKCDKLTGSGFVGKLQHCVSATSSVHSPLCTQTKSAQWSVHRGTHPVGTVQTLSAPWNLLGPPLIPEKKFPATTGRWSTNFVFCNTHCASTCSFCEKNSASHECIHVTNWTHPCDIRKTDQMEQKFNSENQCSDLYDKSCCPLNYHFPLQNAFVNHKPPFNWFQWI